MLRVDPSLNNTPLAAVIPWPMREEAARVRALLRGAPPAELAPPPATPQPTSNTPPPQPPTTPPPQPTTQPNPARQSTRNLEEPPIATLPDEPDPVDATPRRSSREKRKRASTLTDDPAPQPPHRKDLGKAPAPKPPRRRDPDEAPADFVQQEGVRTHAGHHHTY